MDRLLLEIGTCKDAENYWNSVYQKIIMCSHLIFCFLSIIFTVLFYVKCRRYFFFHVNFKMLMYTQLIGQIVHAIALSTNHIYHFVRYFASKSSCDILISASTCMALRFPSHFCTNIFVYIQAAFVIERYVAVVFRKNYEKHKACIGVILLVLTIFASLCLSLNAVRQWDFAITTPYCSNVNLFTYSDIFILFCYTNSGILCATYVGFLVVWIMNHTAKKRCSSEISLGIKFQINENSMVLKMIYPSVTFSFLFNICYTASNLYSNNVLHESLTLQQFREYLAAINTIPLYTFLAPVVMWYVLQSDRTRRQEVIDGEAATTKKEQFREIYFMGYNKMWK